jgi:hypothetical protein
VDRAWHRGTFRESENFEVRAGKRYNRRAGFRRGAIVAEQNFSNHTQVVPGFLAVGLVITLTAIGAGVNLYKSMGDHERLYSASLVFVLSICLFLVAFFGRSFALKAQDRAIRAEENLRYFSITGKLLDPRLTISQVIGLRFASDAEFVALAKRAADESMSMKDIKMAVKNWRPDTHRV